jgi:hypothetical protein
MLGSDYIAGDIQANRDYSAILLKLPLEFTALTRQCEGFLLIELRLSQ